MNGLKTYFEANKRERIVKYDEQKPFIVVVVGPTASGKTELSVALAKKINGEVISGDSMQVYRQMDIGTAKVTQEEMEGVPHHLINILNPDEAFSAYEFKNVQNNASQISLREGKFYYCRRYRFVYSITDL